MSASFVPATNMPPSADETTQSVAQRSPVLRTPDSRAPHHVSAQAPQSALPVWGSPAQRTAAVSQQGHVGWSIERRTRHSCEVSGLHSPPLHIDGDWLLHGAHQGCHGPASSSSFGRGGGGGVGGRGHSMPASLRRPSDLLEGLSGGGDTGPRSIAPARYSAQGPHNTSGHHGSGLEGHMANAHGRDLFSPYDGSARLADGASPRLYDSSLGRPTTLMGNGVGGGFGYGRYSEGWPTARPTTLLSAVPPLSDSPSCEPVGTAYQWLGPSHPYARPLPSSGDEAQTTAQPPGTDGSELPPYATFTGGNSPCGPIDGCTQVWPSTGAPQTGDAVTGGTEAPWNTDLFTEANDLRADPLGSPPRVSASGSLSLARSRPQSCVLRSCSVNDLPWSRGVHQETFATLPPHMDATVAAPPLLYGHEESGGAGLGSRGGATTTCPPAPLFCSEMPGSTTIFSEWADEQTQTNTDLDVIADLDHAPRKSYRHDGNTDDAGEASREEGNGIPSAAGVMTARGDGRSFAAHMVPTPPLGACGSAPPQDASCASSAHHRATRRIADNYTTEEEDDDDDVNGCNGYGDANEEDDVRLDQYSAMGFHEPALLPDPRQLQSSRVHHHATPSAWCTAANEEEGRRSSRDHAAFAAGPYTQDPNSQQQQQLQMWLPAEETNGIRTVSRRQAMEERLSANGAVTSQDEAGGYLSSIGIVEETQNSIDLGAQLASIHVRASPTHKRLAFEDALDEDDAQAPSALFGPLPTAAAPLCVTPGLVPGAPQYLDPFKLSSHNTDNNSFQARMTRHSSLNAASPLSLSNTLLPDEFAPHVAGVWAGRRGMRRYTCRHDASEATGTTAVGRRGSAVGQGSGLSLLSSRKRCLEEMNGSSCEVDDVENFFAVMATADSGGAAPRAGPVEGGVLVPAQHGATSGAVAAKKKFRLEPEKSDCEPAKTFVLCDRSPNVLPSNSPFRKCHEEVGSYAQQGYVNTPTVSQ